MTSAVTELTLRRPDDFHLHLRDGPALAHTVPASAACFARAIVMPNLSPPVTTTEQVRAYHSRILAALPAGRVFQPLMTLYLTDHTAPEEIIRAQASGHIYAAKLYPAGATTHSAAGVTDIRRLDRVFGALERIGMPLLVHGEVTDSDIDVFDRERVFIERAFAPLVERHAGLKVVLEHVTTAEGVAFVEAAPRRVAATITAHHLLLNRNALLQGGLRPHHYCLPILKRERHRQALLRAATSGSPKFFLGTDSAPHSKNAKETACGCAGIYTAPHALALYATAFETVGALDYLDNFAGRYGAEFYGLTLNAGTVVIRRESWRVPEQFPMGTEAVIPLHAGEMIAWRMVDTEPLR